VSEEYIHPPRDCRFCTEDLECLGCGEKIGPMTEGYCGYVEGVKRQRREAEAKELAEYERMKNKFGGKQ
jgi:hypothetical protein